MDHREHERRGLQHRAEKERRADAPVAYRQVRDHGEERRADGRRNHCREAVQAADRAERLSLAAVGLAVASATGAWFELAVLRRRLPREEDAAGLFSWTAAAGPVGAALASAAVGGLLWWLLRDRGSLLQAGVVLPVYGALYLALRWGQLRAELGASKP